MSTIDARHAAEAAELFARCLRAWRRYGSFTEAARLRRDRMRRIAPADPVTKGR